MQPNKAIEFAPVGRPTRVGYILSEYQFNVSKGPAVRWLLGVPIKDSEISIDVEAVRRKVLSAYPKWLVADAQPTLQADGPALELGI